MQVRCRCGEIELAISGPPVAQFFCHCDDCQAAHGAAYAPESVHRAEDVTLVKGHPAAWTLKRNPRLFCPTCGTRLYIEVGALKLRGINGYLLPEGGFQAQYHMQCQFAVRPVHDDLPHYRSRAPQFGGPDQQMDW